MFGSGGGGSEEGHEGGFTHVDGGSGGVVPHGGGTGIAGGGGVHAVLPFSGFDSLKPAVFALLLVVVGLLLMRLVMIISNDR